MKTNNIIVSQLVLAFNNCQRASITLQKAEHTLKKNGIEVEYREVQDACQPHEEAAEHFRKELKKLGWVEGARGSFLQEDVKI